MLDRGWGLSSAQELGEQTTIPIRTPTETCHLSCPNKPETRTGAPQDAGGR